jgi:hypothetical protein
MERDHLEDLGVDGIILLKWFFKTWDGEAWTFNNSTFCQHCVFMCFMWISKQTAIISL